MMGTFSPLSTENSPWRPGSEEKVAVACQQFCKTENKFFQKAKIYFSLLTVTQESFKQQISKLSIIK